MTQGWFPKEKEMVKHALEKIDERLLFIYKLI
jgi:hypothetical protein